MKFKCDMDYVIYFAEQLKKNPKLFEQQKRFLEAQMQGSKLLFNNWKGKNFKIKCREYLKERGII